MEAAISESASTETDLASSLSASEPLSPAASIATPAPDLTSTLTDTALTDSWSTFQELGLGSTWFAGSFQRVFFEAHQLTGLPWWATIAATVLTIRLALFPFAANIIGQTQRQALLQPQFQKIMTRYQDAKKAGDQLALGVAQKEMMDLKVKTGFNPFVFLKLPLLQAPLFLGIFFGLKGMAEAKLPGFMDGGLAWFTNLTIPDPTYALPVASVAATLTVLQVR